jgi:hypothetical protein
MARMGRTNGRHYEHYNTYATPASALTADIANTPGMGAQGIGVNTANEQSATPTIGALSQVANIRGDDAMPHPNDDDPSAIINTYKSIYGVDPTQEQLAGLTQQFGSEFDPSEVARFVYDDTSLRDDPRGAVKTLQQQILDQGFTDKWSGQGFGSAAANAADMARMLASAGITDINQFGKVNVAADAAVTPVYGTRKAFDPEYGEYEERYVTGYTDASGKAVDPSLVKTAYDEYGGTTDYLAPVGTKQVFGNKATGVALDPRYSKAEGNIFSGTFAGDGSTGYGVQFRADGSPVFYTQYMGSSNDLAQLMQDPLIGTIVQAAASYFGGPLGTAALNLAAGRDIGDVAKATLASYVAGEVGKVVSGAPSVIDAVGQTGANIAGRVAGSVATGGGEEGALNALITGGVNAAIPEIQSMIPGYANLPPFGKEFVNNAIASTLQDGSLSQKELISAAVKAGRVAMKNSNTNSGALASVEDMGPTSFGTNITGPLSDAGLTNDQFAADAASMNDSEIDRILASSGLANVAGSQDSGEVVAGPGQMTTRTVASMPQMQARPGELAGDVREVQETHDGRAFVTYQRDMFYTKPDGTTGSYTIEYSPHASSGRQLGYGSYSYEDADGNLVVRVARARPDIEATGQGSTAGPAGPGSTGLTGNNAFDSVSEDLILGGDKKSGVNLEGALGAAGRTAGAGSGETSGTGALGTVTGTGTGSLGTGSGDGTSGTGALSAGTGTGAGTNTETGPGGTSGLGGSGVGTDTGVTGGLGGAGTGGTGTGGTGGLGGAGAGTDTGVGTDIGTGEVSVADTNVDNNVDTNTNTGTTTTTVKPTVVTPKTTTTKTTKKTSNTSMPSSLESSITTTPQVLRGAAREKAMRLAALRQLFDSLTPEMQEILMERGITAPAEQNPDEKSEKELLEKSSENLSPKIDDQGVTTKFFAGGGTITELQGMKDRFNPNLRTTPSMLAAAPIDPKEPPLKLMSLRHLRQGIAKPPKPISELAQGGLPQKYAEAAPEGHKPEFITGLTGYYASGKGTGQSDDIPAMLHDGDYVIDADAVAAFGDGSSKAGAQALSQFQSKVPHQMGTGGKAVAAKIADGEYVYPEAFVTALGGGSNEKGAKMLDAMREELRAHKRSAPTSKIPPKAKSPLDYLRMAKG